MIRPLLFAAAFAAVAVAGGANRPAAAAPVMMTAVLTDQACLDSCAATYAASDQHCRDLDIQGGYNGRLYPTCAAYARYVYNNCVGQCPV